VLPLPTGAAPFSLPLPSGRSLLIAFAAVAAIVGGYFVARETSMFAVQRIEVTGARPSVIQRVDAALAPLDGSSLLALNAADLDERLSPLRDVSLVSYDRAFPHTANVVVSAERPVAVLRRGSQAWIVTERGRVLESVSNPRESGLPRIWDANAPVPSAGDVLTADEALRPARLLGGVLSADSNLFRHVSEARYVDGDLSLVLASGIEIRLGDADELALQLAVAQRVLDTTGPGVQYVDVSVPERAVVR
jgi:cell division septal protein FtsQ